MGRANTSTPQTRQPARRRAPGRGRPRVRLRPLEQSARTGRRREGRMVPQALVALALVVTPAAGDGPVPSLANAGFEEGEAGKPPPGWELLRWSRAFGYQ